MKPASLIAKAGLAIALTLTAASTVSVTPAAAATAELKYIVNTVPVTSYDIKNRQALLRLFRQKADAKKAADEMIDQVLKSKEMERLRINIGKEAVDASYANFAKQNQLQPQQLDQILAQAGLSRDHMKEFIRVQMGWSQALGARFRSTGPLTEQQMVRKVFELGGQKPTATEYMLQKVIFVVPAKERSQILAKRKREAEAMRQRYSGCGTTREFAKGLLDVTVQDIPRVLEPQLPPDWAKQIKAARPGTATTTRETEAGIEFIGVCSAREVSDDQAARMVLSTEGDLDEKGKELSEKYLAELRKAAVIQNR
jgi:peptidyl-prolyl cis-trans isomerase SurA